jgi:hypothetical protein
MTTLPHRVWRRLAQIEPLSMPIAKAKGWIEVVQFQVAARQRARFKEEYARCRTLGEYFELSQRAFGLISWSRRSPAS